MFHKINNNYFMGYKGCHDYFLFTQVVFHPYSYEYLFLTVKATKCENY